MKKILIIANEYYPNPSAITNVFKKVIEHIKSQFEIDVLTKKQTIDMLDEEIINGVKVYRIEDWFYNSYEITDVQKKYNGYVFMKIANRLSLVMMKASRFLDYYINTKIFKNQDGFINKKEAIKLGKRLNKEKKYDTILSLSYPFIMHEIANKIRNKNQKWYVYQLDPHACNNTLNPKFYKKRLKKEIKILKRCNNILLPEENYEQNLKTELKVLKNKYIPVEYSNIIKPEFESNINKKDYIEFNFSGTLYEKLREPYKMLDFFCKIKELDIMKFKIIFYYKTVPTLKEKLLTYKEKLGECLELHENANKKLCDESASKCNILLNIGNDINNQTPSKVFENICTGKPIINFYNIEDDTSKKQLEKYKLALNINTNFGITDFQIKEFERFVQQNKYNQLTFENATKNYKKSEEICEKILKILKGEYNAKD